jgi:circadian clock protein KaiB
MITKKEKYVLRLYISGMSEKSVHAIANINSICKEFLVDCVDLEIIDIYKQTFLAEQEQIIACPSLVKKLPLPKRTLIGDLSDRRKVLSLLGIVEA